MFVHLRNALRSRLTPLVLGFAVLTAIVGGRSLLIERQRQDNRDMLQSFETERRILSTLSLMQDAETSQRGYLLTGEPDYLEPYRAAVNGLPTQISDIRAALSANPAQQDQMDALQKAIDDKLSELKVVLDLYDSRKVAQALDLVQSDRGKLAMDRVRAIITRMRHEENARIRLRLATAETTDDWLRIGSILALLGVFVMALHAVWNARRQLAEMVVVNGRVADANKALRDEIDTREAAEAKVRQMQKMEAIGQLTGGIAHDFNNMLAVIISAMNLAQRKLARGETDVEKFVEAASDAASRAANLTARLLAFSRQQPLAPRSIDANRLVTGMSDLLRRTLGEAIQVETVLAGGLWRTFADISQVENAVLNLAVNARDAMPEGGKLTIETANSELDERYAKAHAEVAPGQYVMLAVTDTGTGIPPEIVAKVFEPFFTTKGVNKGTGLGLSQVFGFVKQSGGHVKIYSEPGEGTTVKIYLPRRFGEEPQAQTQAAPDLDKRASETVLVVEDDERVRAGTVAALRELGYVVVHAADATEALLRLDANPAVALLFTDVMMPVTNGRKLAEMALAKRPDLKILFTTGFTKNAVVHNGVLDPGVDFLAKPFTIDQLSLKLRDILDR